jgi:hypothetical protein
MQVCLQRLRLLPFLNKILKNVSAAIEKGDIAFVDSYTPWTVGFIAETSPDVL